MSAVNLSIDNLLLDSENPRIGSASNQRDALQKIIDDQGDKLAELAQDISSEGLSPIERLLVISEKKSSDRYIAVEGNRRVAALKILANPAVLSSLSLGSALQKRLERIASDFNRKNIEPISCFEIENRDEAKKWVYLRHTGANEGRGVVSWSGLAAARFRGTDPALQALEFVREHGNLHDRHKMMLDNFPITTLDRLLSTRDVRELIGVDIKNNKLRSALDGAELIKPLRRMVLDLAEKKINVSDLKNRDMQVEYVKSFDSNDKPILAKKGSIREVEEFKNGEFKVKQAQPPISKRRVYDPSDRRTLVPKPLKLNISATKVAEIYRELRSLWMDESPNACAVLLRMFIELSIDSYMRANNLDIKFKEPKSGHKFDKALDRKVREVIDDLVNKKGRNRKDFDGVIRALNDRGSPLHIDLLHAYIHSLFQTPQIRDLRCAWDIAEPLFKEIWA
jgi:hypothetical protein